MAGLARVATLTDGESDVVDEGVGPLLATPPIMRWLNEVQGPVDQFNQTVLIQAPVGVTENDVLVVLQAVLDRHAMLRLRIDDDGAGGGGRRPCSRRERWMPRRACRPSRCSRTRW